MTEAKWDFGAVTWIDADAVGEPGQRRFRLRLQNDFMSGVIWLEKEQLRMLGFYIDRLLEQFEDHRALGSIPGELMPSANVSFPDEPIVEFTTFRLALGYDQASDMIAIIAHEWVEESVETEEAPNLDVMLSEEATVEVTRGDDAEPPGDPTLICRASRRQLKELAERITRTVAAGRPRCRLCGAPMNPGEPHICPRANGYHKVDLS